MEASTVWNPQGLFRPVISLLYLLCNTTGIAQLEFVFVKYILLLFTSKEVALKPPKPILI
jgi:ABC-type uncharacterized transport system permease subunit